MGRKRRAYSHEFKAEAVRLLLDSGRPTSQVARELGVRADVLRSWKQQAEGVLGLASEAAAESAGSIESAEVRRLKRELEIVRQERDFLKKAAAYFAKESP
jgi:transposase